jgi:hypothetical protein
MARKGWNALSPGYKSRLQKAGITEADYTAGSSITGARGHLHTPERPSQANPVKHATYLAERNRLVSRITRKKQHWFGTSPKWNPGKAAQAFRDKPPTLANLRYWDQLDRDEWIDALRSDESAAAYLGYH